MRLDLSVDKEGIERDCDLAASIGYHAKAGTAHAVLDHTCTDRILDARLNGVAVGELGLNAALAGSFDVPVAPVSGDQSLAAECLALLGRGVARVVVKESVGHREVFCAFPTIFNLAGLD